MRNIVFAAIALGAIALVGCDYTEIRKVKNYTPDTMNKNGYTLGDAVSDHFTDIDWSLEERGNRKIVMLTAVTTERSAQYCVDDFFRRSAYIKVNANNINILSVKPILLPDILLEDLVSKVIKVNDNGSYDLASVPRWIVAKREYECRLSYPEGDTMRVAFEYVLEGEAAGSAIMLAAERNGKEYSTEDLFRFTFSKEISEQAKETVLSTPNKKTLEGFWFAYSDIYDTTQQNLPTNFQLSFAIRDDIVTALVPTDSEKLKAYMTSLGKRITESDNEIRNRYSPGLFQTKGYDVSSNTKKGVEYLDYKTTSGFAFSAITLDENHASIYFPKFGRFYLTRGTKEQMLNMLHLQDSLGSAKIDEIANTLKAKVEEQDYWNNYNQRKFGNSGNEAPMNQPNENVPASQEGFKSMLDAMRGK